MTSRRKLREIIFSLLFQVEVGDQDPERLIELAIKKEEISPDERKFFRALVRGVVLESIGLDGIIEQYSQGWKVSRIARADLTILRMSIYEMIWGLSGLEADAAVVINEAVLLAKKYSGTESGRYINGILGSIARDMTNKNKTVGQVASEHVFKKQ